MPDVTDDTAAFWEGGADGVLRIHRCRACRVWFHPPAPVCPGCLSTDVGPEPTSGRATVQGFSINVQPWAPDMEVPYVVGVVSIDDAPGVQLTTRFVDVEPAAMHVGMPVEVTYLRADDVYLPLFRPTEPVS
jgi:uncharacterized OB-fold protein